MSQLRLVRSNFDRRTLKNTQKRSAPRSIALSKCSLLFWKIERLQARRPAVVDVIENLVDDAIARLDRRKKSSPAQPTLFDE